MTENIKKYYNIIERYKVGEFGLEYLNVYELLKKAGEENLFDEMSLDEIDYLIEKSYGIGTLMFTNIKNNKLEKVKKCKIKIKN